jgi:hypothetical protein
MNAPTPSQPGAALHRLLDASLGLPAEYANELTSHLPMALHALAQLGADALRLQRFFDHYARRFEGRAAEPKAAAVNDWLPLRGRADAFGALQATFAAALRRQGRDATLRAALPALWPGAAAAAFHGLIRTAHALQSGHDGELAAALAYWAWRWQPMADGDEGPPLPFDAWSERLIEAGRSSSFEGGLISHRMARAAATSADYRSLATRLRPDDRLPQRLWAFAAQRYAATRNFTVLHMVTGVRALHVLLPWADDAAGALRETVRAYTAAYLAANVPPHDLAPVVELDWSTLVARAMQSEDDHVIKLVHACRVAEQARIAGPFRAAASRAVG